MTKNDFRPPIGKPTMGAHAMGIGAVMADERIDVHTCTRLTGLTGFLGDFEADPERQA